MSLFCSFLVCDIFIAPKVYRSCDIIWFSLLGSQRHCYCFDSEASAKLCHRSLGCLGLGVVWCKISTFAALFQQGSTAAALKPLLRPQVPCARSLDATGWVGPCVVVFGLWSYSEFRLPVLDQTHQCKRAMLRPGCMRGATTFGAAACSFRRLWPVDRLNVNDRTMCSASLVAVPLQRTEQ
jgi:hypothetical protein